MYPLTGRWIVNSKLMSATTCFLSGDVFVVEQRYEGSGFSLAPVVVLGDRSQGDTMTISHEVNVHIASLDPKARNMWRMGEPII